LLCFHYFLNRVLLLCPNQPGLWWSHLCFLCSWDCKWYLKAAFDKKHRLLSWAHK
jgi:hypothetical protein